MIYGSQDGHIDGITLKDVSVDLVKTVNGLVMVMISAL